MYQTEAAEPELSPVQIDQADLLYALEHDPELWIQFHLAKELEYPVPEFHKTTFKQMVLSTVSRLALALPRGHAKTTLAKLAVVWFFVFSTYRFVLYVSNTNAVAKASCVDIINFMKADNFVSVFGKIKIEKESETEGYWVFTIQDPKTKEDKRCIMRALGAGQQVRGLNIDNQRPEVTVVDDLEDEENTGTEGLRLKLKKWVYGTFFKALSRKNKIIWLGNMISNNCILKDHCESDYWHSSRMGCLLSDGTPLWPDLWPLHEIKKDFIEYQKLGMITTWFAEMMNMPLPDGMGLIRAEDVYYKPPIVPGHSKYGFITIDPAMSQQTWANSTAITVHALVDGIWQIVDYVCGKYKTDEIYDHMISLALKWRFYTVGIENVTFSSILEQLFQYYLQRDRYTSFTLVPLYSQGVRKTERLMGWCGMLKSKDYALTEGDYRVTEQLLQYDPSKRDNNDDLIDACAYGVQMLQNYMNIVMQEVTGEEPSKVQSSYQIAGI